MKRPWQIWIVFAGCLTIVVLVVGWLTWKAIELDRAEELAHRQTLQDENARLALWRIEIAISPLVALESARPAFTFDSYIPLQQDSESAARKPQSLRETKPSPLLLSVPERTLLHFQLDGQGVFTSPRVPLGAERARAVPHDLGAEQWEQSRRLLERVRSLAGLQRLLTSLPPDLPQPAEPVPASLLPMESRPIVSPSPFSQLTDREWQQQARRLNEYLARSQFVRRNGAIMPRLNADPHWISSPDSPVLMTPLCIENELFLARRVKLHGADVIQGCWLDWPAIKKQMQDVIHDLLPAADLQPVGYPATEQFRLVAALPVWLALAPPAPAKSAIGSSVSVSMMVAWGSLLVAAVVAGILLQEVISLSERRGAFVSAVTHELRTPLTTFRMYAEMLATDMLPDEATRRRYLNTLCQEADRLSHLVENVLAYARIERGSGGTRNDPTSIDSLLDRATSRLEERARQSSLQFCVEADAAIRDRYALADASAVEQILFNLVDNACKYASGTTDRNLLLTVSPANDRVELRLRDFGPGISDFERQRLFQPFRKSARDAAHSAPGVGLGLSLCRRLARDMGGDLRLDPTVTPGACFVLSLPMSPSRPIVATPDADRDQTRQ